MKALFGLLLVTLGMSIYGWGLSLLPPEMRADFDRTLQGKFLERIKK
jgi:hypothetical protein